MVGRGENNLDSSVINDVIKIAEEIEQEKQNPERDEKKISSLMYEQLIKGMYLNTGYNRFYNRSF